MKKFSFIAVVILISSTVIGLIIAFPFFIKIFFEIKGGIFLSFIGFQALMTGVFIRNGFQIIQNDPPNRGLVTVLGERTNISLKEGFVFLPFYPWIFGLIRVEMTEKNMSFEPKRVRTPDMAELVIPHAITFYPDPENLTQFLNVGGESGVREILEDVIAERIRTWAIESTNGPQNYQEALGVKNDLEDFVLKTIAGESLEKSKEGRGKIKISSLGIILTRFNVTEISLTGKLAKDAEKKSRENAQKEAESVERKHFIESIREISEKLNISIPKATELFLIQTRKVKKDIKQQQVDFTGRTGEALKSILDIFKKGEEK
ncbi:MAG: SPFH domain-containing protein [Candidatus Paceibacterota bacterium]